MTDAKVPAAEGRIADLIRVYAEARFQLDQAKEAAKPLQAAKDRAEADLFDAMENQNLRSVRHGTLGLFMLSDLAEPQLLDAVQFVRWAEDAMPEILTANRQRLAVVIREILRGERDRLSADGDGLPPGVGFTTRRNINWRKAP